MYSVNKNESQNRLYLFIRATDFLKRRCDWIKSMFHLCRGQACAGDGLLSRAAERSTDLSAHESEQL